ncbi:MAG: YlxR family protein [Clostridia bacterium]|nr:YlxR family protein [Clostridia bacterium]
MKNLKRQPQRTCMGCNEKKDKKDLIRIVKNKENEISIDRTGRLDGRGAYICDDIKCLEKVIKSKRLEKVFDYKISDEIYENLRGVILDK